jgi:hypothetical protein
MDEEGWITFYEAACDIHQRIGGSLAEAQMKLRRACGDELIRTRKAPYEDVHQLPFEFWTRVAPREWREREVDYDGPDANGCKMVAMIHEDDFRQWLDKTIAVGPSPKKPRSSRQVDLAREAINAVCPNYEHLPTPQIQKQVGDWLKAQGKPAVKRDAILRATGRRK